MDSLPPEILCDIFLKTLPCLHFKDRSAYSESISHPLRVSHVCRSWRELALSFRELWSHLHINPVFYRKKQKQKMMVEIFDTWLARTNDAPINFMINGRLPSNATIQDHECVEYIYTTLVENQHRWKDVYLICYGVELSPRFTGFKLTNMPLLTSLILEVDRSVHSVIDLTPSSRLRYLDIDHDEMNIGTGSQLPHLECLRLTFTPHERFNFPRSNQSVLSCLELLKNAPSLHSVRILTRLKVPQSRLPLDGERYLLSDLRKLSLMEGCASHLSASIVDTVTLPSLESFTCCCGTVGTEILLPFFRRSAPPLTSLHLRCKNAYEGILIDILRLIPDLQELALYNATLSCRFFHELTVPDGVNDYTSATDRTVCPRLSMLDIDGRFSETNGWLEPLRTMTKSRAFILGTFKTIHFSPGFRDTVITIADIDNFTDGFLLAGHFIFE